MADDDIQENHMELDERIMIRLPAAVRASIKRRASTMTAETGVTISESDVVRKYIESGLRRDGKASSNN